MTRTTRLLRLAVLAAVLASALTAQSGPTAPPASGLSLWLRSDRGVTTSGTGVTSWADQSGQGVVLNSGTASPPTLTPNALNGLPALTFTGTEQLDGMLSAPVTAGSVFALVRYANPTSPNEYLYSVGTPAGSGSMYSLSRRSGASAYHFDGSRTNIEGSLPHAQFFIASQIYGGNDPTAHRLYRGAETLMQTNASNGYATDGSIRIGNYSSGNFRFKGDLVEFLVYDRALSGQDILRVWQYLRERGGLPPLHRPADGSLADWTPIQYELNQQPDADWQVEPEGQSVFQRVNADASILLAPARTRDASARGSFRASTGGDFIGFAFGYQNRRQFYLFDWKRQTAAYCGASRTAGMRVRIVDMQNGMDPTCAQLWDDVDTVHTTTLQSNTTPWSVNTDYDYELTRTPGGFQIRILTGGTVLEDWTINDTRFPDGRFGLYINSQQSVTFTRPELGCADPSGVEYGAGCTGVLGLEPRLSSCGGAVPGQPFSLVLSNCIGGSASTIVLGTSRLSVPLGSGCTLLVGNFLGDFGFLAVPGAAPQNSFSQLTVGLPTTLPTGANLNFQGATLDPTAPQGFILSKGYEVTVR